MKVVTQGHSRRDESHSPASPFRPPPTTPRSCPWVRPGAERGVALVITLIMLSVITFMAIAFLVLSRGERTSVGTATDQSLARLAADNALERAQVELVVPMIASGNPFSAGLLVSTNLINPLGFIGGNANQPILTSPTNVAYTYGNGSPLSEVDLTHNLTNLLINPRPPVFVVTNRLTGGSDFRYYLDLNRNRTFEPTGWINVTNGGIRVTDPKTGNLLVDYVQGDPQWIGALEFPDRRHSPDNRFLYRYAYLAVPASQTLDINYIHNYAKAPDTFMRAGTGDGFLRNQGVGTWEINLGAFLADLNTNVWNTNAAPYRYYGDPPPAATYTLPNRGVAFDDALSLLRYRYFGNLGTMRSVQSLFSVPGTKAFAADYVDGYSAGPPMTSTHWSGLSGADSDSLRATKSWPGADNTNHFFSTQDFFDPTKVSQAFVDHLTMANADTNSTYNRNTFYRLLSQLGTDSAPEPPWKINLNYDNKVQANVRGIVSATNFIPWRPIDFFTNTAAMLLTNAGFTLSPGRIMVYPTNFYTPSIHRLMQVAANIYDATTNRTLVSPQGPFYPSVFRPIFRREGTNIFIAGYREVVNANMASGNLAPRMIELDSTNPPLNLFPTMGAPISPIDKNEPMVSGVPLIVGAKKGFPNFNEFAMQTQLFISRLLEFRRTSSTGPVTQTNQMYVVGITNTFAVEAWNSYVTNYSQDLQLVTSVSMTATLTNELGGTANILVNNRISRGTNYNIGANTWKGWAGGPTANSMILPFGQANTFMFLNNSTYIPRPPWFVPQTHEFERGSGAGNFYVPRWWLNLNTRLLFILVDTRANRIIDYVNIDNWERTIDINAKLMESSALGGGSVADYKNPANQWLTNRLGNSPSITAPTYGIINQIQVGLNGTSDWQSYSQDPYSGLDAESAVDFFRYNLMNAGPIFPKDTGKTFYKSNVFYAPFNPYRPIYVHTTWQANDPLVHYTTGDLVDLSVDETNRVNFYSLNPPLANIGQINTRYRPWGGNPQNNDPMTDTQMAVKDPFVVRSDDWDFPTNKFPNVGWLGRVHRGTPWQTIFLKSTNFLQSAGRYDLGVLNWAKWTGNPAQPRNWGQIQTNLVPLTNFVADAIFTAPTNDWHIIDLFTTAFNENAGQGQLSVNQTNLAAWSAVLSGVTVLPNANSFTNIEPALAYNPSQTPNLVKIVDGINSTRTNFPNRAFARLGDVLATPQLTVESPYLSRTNRAVLNDAVVERIPQQILGLLHGGDQAPRFVIYSYGQALKPAAKSLYMKSGPAFGLCTNYQITAEVATRAVVRVEGAPNKPRTVIESFNVLPPD
jgi:hypothetical protein